MHKKNTEKVENEQKNQKIVIDTQSREISEKGTENS